MSALPDLVADDLLAWRNAATDGVPRRVVETLGQPEVPAAQAYYRGDRWAALKPGAPTTEVMRWPLPLAPPAVELGLPRGARTLQKADAHLHGGISLQECVPPHLVS